MLEIMLTVFLWIILGMVLIEKQRKAQDEVMDTIVCTLYIIFAPLVLVVAIVRQVFYERWR
jgi:hypothetical protein